MPRRPAEPMAFAGRMHDIRGPFGSIVSVACEGPGCEFCAAPSQPSPGTEVLVGADGRGRPSRRGPSAALGRAIRAGCGASDIHLRCSWPDCTCRHAPAITRAALAEALSDANAEVLADRCGRDVHEVVDVLAALRREFGLGR